ncbi:MAG TPA: thioredoxin family protein [Trebonia sp.]|nr:thioredoxin family protein [Trebonia sp.]
MIFVELLSVPGCDACVRLRAVLARVTSDLPHVTVKEVDLAEHPEVAARYQVMACPAVAVGGRVQFVGGVDERRLRQLLTQSPDRTEVP